MNYTQIKADTTFWISGDSTVTVDFTAADMLIRHNERLNEVVSIIMEADGRWEWDDSNLTTLPIATTDVVSGQGDYQIAASDFLNIIKVEMKDENGEWFLLHPMSYADTQGISVTNLDDTAGTPTMYDKVANSIILHTKPNYASTGGLKAFFQRAPHYFVIGDTTAVPGFNPLYHSYISMGAALDYCSINGMDTRIVYLTNRLAEMRASIIKSYSTRSKDEPLRMSVHSESYGNEGRGAISENRI